MRASRSNLARYTDCSPADEFNLARFQTRDSFVENSETRCRSKERRTRPRKRRSRCSSCTSVSSYRPAYRFYRSLKDLLARRKSGILYRGLVFPSVRLNSDNPTIFLPIPRSTGHVSVGNRKEVCGGCLAERLSFLETSIWLVVTLYIHVRTIYDGKCSGFFFFFFCHFLCYLPDGRIVR